jgi:hypothetical protein
VRDPAELIMVGPLTSAQRKAYRNAGALPFAGTLLEEVIAPARAIALAMARQAPDQDMLSGIHNPFGHHACAAQAWSFLDIAENPQLLDSVEDVIGPDIILWDVELYLGQLSLPPDEGQCWPVDPLAGTIAVISLERAEFGLIDIGKLTPGTAGFTNGCGATLAARYMPATSRFNRDQAFPANRRATEARPLVNYTRRPIWLVRGADRAGNDFVTGFMVPAARWSNANIDDAMPDGGNRVRPDRF